MIYPHEIVVPPVGKEDDKFMHVMHNHNMGADKSWYIKKGILWRLRVLNLKQCNIWTS